MSEELPAHVDLSHQFSPTKRTLLTVLVFLTSEFRGGGTEFIGGKCVKPETARVLLFPHEMLHRGGPTSKGTKLVLKADVVCDWFPAA